MHKITITIKSAELVVTLLILIDLTRIAVNHIVSNISETNRIGLGSTNDSILDSLAESLCSKTCYLTDIVCDMSTSHSSSFFHSTQCYLRSCTLHNLTNSVTHTLGESCTTNLHHKRSHIGSDNTTSIHPSLIVTILTLCITILYRLLHQHISSFSMNTIIQILLGRKQGASIDKVRRTASQQSSIFGSIIHSSKKRMIIKDCTIS